MQLVPGRRADTLREPARVHGVVEQWILVAFWGCFEAEGQRQVTFRQITVFRAKVGSQ